MDLEKIKNELENFSKKESESNSEGSDGKIFKPEIGTQVLRFVPYKFNKDMPFIKLYFHYGLMGKNYLSPVSFDEPDPIVEFSKKLISSGNRDDFKLGKKLEPKMRIYAPVIIRGKEHEGVKFWGFSKTIYTQLLGIIADPDYGDITHPKTGRDIKVTKTSKEQSDTNYPKIEVMVKPNVTPVTDDSDIIDLIKNQDNIKDVLYIPDYAKLKETLSDWLSQNEDVDNTEAEPESPKSNSSTNSSLDDLSESGSENKKSVNSNDIAQKFDDLF